MAATVGPVGLFTLDAPKTAMGLEGLRRLPKFQPRRSTALGLIEQTAVNSQPTVRNADADLTTYLYDPSTVPPVMDINTLRPKITIPVNPPMQLRASLAQGLNELARLNQATNAIGAITAANNALALGNIDRAEAVLGRPLTRQEIANRNVTPILRRDERNPGVAIDIGNQNPNSDTVAANNNPVYGTDAASQTEREVRSSGHMRRNYDTGAIERERSSGSASSGSTAGTRDPVIAPARSEASTSTGAGGAGGGGNDDGDGDAGPSLDSIARPSVNTFDDRQVMNWQNNTDTMPVAHQLFESQQRAEPVSGMQGVSIRQRVNDTINWLTGINNREKELGNTGNSMSVDPRLLPPVSSSRPPRREEGKDYDHPGHINNGGRPGLNLHIEDDDNRFENQHDTDNTLTGGSLKKNYVPLGKFLVHKHKLSGGQLSMCYPNGKKLHDFPNTLLSKNMHHHIVSMVDRTVPAKHIKLKPEEHQFVSRLKRRVFGAPSSAAARKGGLHTWVPLKEQLMIALGEIQAGNDSPKIKMRIKRMLPQLKYVVSPEFISQIKQKFL